MWQVNDLKNSFPMIKVLVLICGCVEGMTQWNTETIRQQEQFSNVPPASIDEYKFLFQWYDHWLKNTGFFAFVDLLDVWFAVEGRSEAWGEGSSVVIEVDLNLDLAGPTSVGFHPPPVCAGRQLAFSSLPAPGFTETLLRAAARYWHPSPCSQLVLCPEHLQTAALCTSISGSSLSRETANSGGEEAKWC